MCVNDDDFHKGIITFDRLCLFKMWGNLINKGQLDVQLKDRLPIQHEYGTRTEPVL